MKEGVTQQSTRGEAEQHLEQVLVLVTVGLNWDQEQDEERSRADQQGGAESLQKQGERRFALRYMMGRSTQCHECNISWGLKEESESPVNHAEVAYAP